MSCAFDEYEKYRISGNHGIDQKTRGTIIFILFQTIYDLFHTDYTISDLFTTQQMELALKNLEP